MKKLIGVIILLVVIGAGGLFGYKMFFAVKGEEAPPEETAAAETVSEEKAEGKPEEKVEKGFVDEIKDKVLGMIGADSPKEKAKEEKPKKPDAKKTEKEKKKSEQAARRDKEMKAEEAIKQGNQLLLSGKNAEADEAFRNAVETAQSNEQKYKAWRGRAMAAKMMGQGDAELSFGNAMLELAESDGDKANAHEAKGNGYENVQRYPEAVTSYQEASALYMKAGNTDMGWTTLVSCAKVMRRGLNDYVGAAEVIGRAWEIVDKSSMDEVAKRDAKWMLCLEYADNSRMSGDRQAQLNWNREAVKYNPDWKQNADMIERELKNQGVI